MCNVCGCGKTADNDSKNNKENKENNLKSSNNEPCKICGSKNGCEHQKQCDCDKEECECKEGECDCDGQGCCGDGECNCCCDFDEMDGELAEEELEAEQDDE